MANRTILALSDEALEVIARRAPSVNKRGMWVSQALVLFDKMLTGEVVAPQGILERIETEIKGLSARLQELEDKVG